jgi:N-methylhydantoinase A/oxoprolinase/acetone carboxylase beta subunit
MADEVRLEQSAVSDRGGPIGERPVYFSELKGFQRTRVYSRYGLAAGEKIEGPAIIEEAESTVVVGPRASVTVDNEGNLVMHLSDRRPQA